MIINQRFLAGGILIIGILASLFLTWDALASSPFDITFPIAELDNCRDKDECKAYCDRSENAAACLAFARKHGLVVKDELDRAERLVNVKNGPGGCDSRESCESYCNNIDHIDECVAFAEQNNLMDQDDLAEAKKVRDAVKRGAKLPGGCQDRNSCEAYCSDPSKTRECLAFAREAGFIDKEEAERAEKFIPLMERGETPGGCRTKETCEQYCFEEDHLEECIAFGEKVGAISEKDREILRKTGGRGPGGCRGRQCEAFCQDPANQKACFEFAKEHGLIKEADLRRMEEGRQHLRRGLEQAPPQVQDCVQSILGPDGLAKIEAGEFFGGPELGEKMRACFGQVMPQFGGPGMGGAEGFPGGEFRGPGGCQTPEECQNFCQSNPEECRQFMPSGGGVLERQAVPEFSGPTYEANFPLVCDPGWEVSFDNVGRKYCAMTQSKCSELNPGHTIMHDQHGRAVCAGAPRYENFAPPVGNYPPEGFTKPPSPEEIEKYRQQYQRQYEEQFRQYQQLPPPTTGSITCNPGDEPARDNSGQEYCAPVNCAFRGYFTTDPKTGRKYCASAGEIEQQQYEQQYRQYQQQYQQYQQYQNQPQDYQQYQGY
jgi:hypothetical protein